VGLYNSNTADSLNLASELYNVDAVDVSSQVTEEEGASVAGGEITGTQVISGDEFDTLDVDGGKCEIDWERESLDPLLWKYNYGYPISFGGGTWGSTAGLSVSHSGNGKQSPTYNTVSASYIGKMYTGFSTSFTAYASFRSWTDFVYGNDEIATTRFMLDVNGTNSTWTLDPQLHKDGIYMRYYNQGTIWASKNWGYNDYGDSTGTFSLGLVTLGNSGRPGADTMSVKSDIALNRRTINGDFYLQCFTANDNNLTNTDIAKYSSVNYDNLINKIEITNGGVNGSRLYEGSSVKITLESSNLVCTGAGIYDENTGTLLSNGAVSGNSVSFSSIIVEPGSTDNPKNYSFRLTFQRRQVIAIDVGTST
jgi:hypothetical protein